MSEDSESSKEDIMFEAAKTSGKQILAGLGKASMVFTKRMAEGAFNAQVAQSQEEETSKKIKVASSEIGKAFLKGAMEGGSLGMGSIIEGVNKFSKDLASAKPAEDQSEPHAEYQIEDISEDEE